MLLVGRNAAAFAIILPPAQAAMRRDSDRNAAGLNQKPGLKSWPISAVAAIQMRQRMRVSSSFFERKKSGECSAHSQIFSAFRDCGASRRGENSAGELHQTQPGVLKKEKAECVYLLTQNAHCDSRRTHSALFFLSQKGPINLFFQRGFGCFQSSL